MKKLALFAVFLASLALSSFMGASEARAVEPAGHSFCPGGMPGGPEELARKMERSLAADPTGNRKVEGCHAAPIHWLVAFQSDGGDPEAGLTSVSQLPAYVRKLVPMNRPQGEEFRTSCLHEAPNGVLGVTMNCLQRAPRQGEVLYGNPDTGRIVLWSSCVNPGFGPPMDIVVEGPRCIEVRFPSMKGLPPPRQGQVGIRGAYIGPRALPGRCHALLLAGEQDRRCRLRRRSPRSRRRAPGSSGGRRSPRRRGPRRVPRACSGCRSSAAIRWHRFAAVRRRGCRRRSPARRCRRSSCRP